MPSEMTSMPARFFAWTLRSISANRYGGMRLSLRAPAWVLLKVVEDSGQRIGLDVEPSDSLVTTPPPQLPARVAPVRTRHRVRESLDRDLTANVRHRLRVTDSRQHRGGRRNPGVEGR